MYHTWLNQHFRRLAGCNYQKLKLEVTELFPTAFVARRGKSCAVARKFLRMKNVAENHAAFRFSLLFS
jgi:hypothetical protein